MDTSPADKAEMFSRIAASYDRINTVISLTVHRRWRRKAASLCGSGPASSIADLCCGTGDFALEIARLKTPPARISCYDISPKMLEIAAKKYRLAKTKSSLCPFEFITADCARLPCPDNSFDILTCAFGLRNTEQPAQTIAEMFRVLKPAGRLCILEFTLPINPLLRKIYLLYFRFALPLLAALFGGDREAYEYFVRSVCRWDSSVDVVAMLTAAGFQNVRLTKLTFGIAAVYTAQKT